MGSIRKVGRVYWMRYYRHGRRLEENTHTAIRDDARDLLKQREGAIAAGQTVSPKANRLRFEEAVADLEADYTINGRRTLTHVQRRLRLHLLPVFGWRRLVDITASDILTFVQARLTAGASNAETESIYRRYAIVDAGALRDAAARIDGAALLSIVKGKNAGKK